MSKFPGINLSLTLTLGLFLPLGQLPILTPELPPTGETEILPEVEPEFKNDFSRPSYVLGAGDEIDINVFGYDEFTGQQVILPDGTISLPLIGRVMAANSTVDGLVEKLTEVLEPWLVDPVVTVGITKLRPMRVNIAGEVRRPGPIQLRSLNRNDVVEASSFELPTVSLALSKAGGVTSDADIRKIAIARSNINGESTIITLNLWDALVSEDAPPDLTLQDGDAIFVPKLEPDSAIDSRLVARSTLAPQTVRVRVVGEVKRPGEVAVPPDGSISSAIAIAGGPTDKATLHEVKFIRLQADGKIEEQTLDLSNLNDSQQIQEGDVIIVPKSLGSTALDVSNQVANPFNTIINLVNLIRLFGGEQ